jgi:hypothetical protein
MINRSYNRVVFDVTVDELVITEDGKWDQWSTNNTKQELNLSVFASKTSCHGPFVVWSHPGFHVLP